MTRNVLKIDYVQHSTFEIRRVCTNTLSFDSVLTSFFVYVLRTTESVVSEYGPVSRP